MSSLPVSTTDIGCPDGYEMIAVPLRGQSLRFREVVGEKKSVLPGKQDKVDVSTSSPSSESKEEKKVVPQGASPPVSRLHGLLRAAVAKTGKKGGARGKKNDRGIMLRTKMVYEGAGTSSTDTVVRTNIALQPSLSAEWSSAAGLFDEVRVTGARFHYRYYVNGTSSSPVDGGAGYSNTDASVFTKIGDVFQCPWGQILHVGDPTSVQSYPIAKSDDGFRTLTVKVHTDNVREAATPALAGGWMSTADSADVWGYFKIIIEATTGGKTTGNRWFVELDTEFRFRQ